MKSPDASADAWVDSVVSEPGRPLHLAERLRTDLARFAGRPLDTGRYGVAVMDADPHVASRVIAAGWVEVGPLVDVGGLAEALRSARLPGAVLSRDVRMHESRRTPAVSCQDLMTDPRAADGTVLHERCAVVVAHPATAVSVRLELSTSDLTAFEDIAGACLEVARRVRPAAGGDVA
ncbi:hypothetical protein KDN32_17040 [Nocardioides sp. J2M5]|uniref:hypothetical protein n=1 Tax=Nocardioides palaemonis TaxID=2829810 RepID=UPI001BA955C2|nr:hypothetical protein [Nocardioides palaemonis]MBS2939449.1 hypothetical protein [Nocardioides palaemonis]